MTVTLKQGLKGAQSWDTAAPLHLEIPATFAPIVLLVLVMSCPLCKFAYLTKTIIYLLVTHSTHIHKARCSVIAYLVTINPFTPLLGRK